MSATLSLLTMDGTTLQLHSLRIIHFLSTQGNSVFVCVCESSTTKLTRSTTKKTEKNSVPVGKTAIPSLLQLLASSSNEYVRAQVLQTLDYMLLTEENRVLSKKVFVSPTGNPILQASRQLVAHPFARSLTAIIDDL